jgi:hypothetical protein
LEEGRKLWFVVAESREGKGLSFSTAGASGWFLCFHPCPLYSILCIAEGAFTNESHTTSNMVTLTPLTSNLESSLIAYPPLMRAASLSEFLPPTHHMPPSHYLLNSRHIYSLYTSNAPTHS